MTGSVTYRVAYESEARKELSKLDRPVARRVHAAVIALASDPRPRGRRQLAGHTGLWRIRVGDYRVVYSIDDGELLALVVRVAHRGRAHRRL